MADFDDELFYAQQRADQSRSQVEDTLERLQTRIDKSTENFRKMATAPLRMAGDHPFTVAAFFLFVGLIVGVLGDEDRSA